MLQREIFRYLARILFLAEQQPPSAEDDTLMASFLSKLMISDQAASSGKTVTENISTKVFLYNFTN
jgi:hypothetical protein